MPRRRALAGLEAGLLIAWSLHVLLFVWFTPPWQHYDEPTHLEYALLIRELGRLPTHDEQLPGLRRAIGASMVASGLFRNAPQALPAFDLDSPGLTLGFNERAHPPLYYIGAALATLPARAAPIEAQLRMARLWSAALAALMFYAAARVLRLALPGRAALRLNVLGLLALNPALADIMSAVNSDALANLLAMLVFGAAVWALRAPRRGMLLIGALLLLALAVKRTLFPLAGLAGLAALAAAPRRLRRAALIGLAGAGALAALALVATPWALADWRVVDGAGAGYRRVPALGAASGAPPAPFRGRALFELARPPDGPGAMIEQELFPEQRRRLAGQVVTLSGWMRADRDDLPAVTPSIQYSQTVVFDSLLLGTHWKYVAISAALPPGASYLAIRLHGPLAPGRVFYDGLALVEGSAPADAGIPDGAFEPALVPADVPPNFVRNPGAERRIPLLASAFERFGQRYVDRQGWLLFLSHSFDLDWIRAAYPGQMLALFQGFWGIFGWGDDGLAPGWFNSLGLLVAASLAGAARISWAALRPAPDRAGLPCAPGCWWLCLAAVLLGWGAAMLRVHSQPVPGLLVLGFGRYTFIVALPALVVFAAGLRALLPRRLRRQGMRGILCFAACLALASFWGTLLPRWLALTAG